MRSAFRVEQGIGQDQDAAGRIGTEFQPEFSAGIRQVHRPAAAVGIERETFGFPAVADPGQLNFAGDRKRGMQSDPAGEPPEHLRSDRIEQGAFEVGAERKSVFESPAIQFQRKGFSLAVNCFAAQE